MSKAVILAGGRGGRLFPFTQVINKHLLPVVDQPMIYYPIETLKAMGYDDILIITGGENVDSFITVLGDGAVYNIKLTYRVQIEPNGIAGALSLAEGFTKELFPVILGDNFFEYPVPSKTPAIVVKEVEDPERFGVYDGQKIVEKPQEPKTNTAVIGLYWFDGRVYDVIRTLKPSGRGELEVTDINNWYLERGAGVLQYEGFWSDMGTVPSLNETVRWLHGKGA